MILRLESFWKLAVVADPIASAKKRSKDVTKGSTKRKYNEWGFFSMLPLAHMESDSKVYKWTALT